MTELIETLLDLRNIKAYMNSDNAIDAQIQNAIRNEKLAGDDMQHFYGCIRPTVKRYRSDDIEDDYNQRHSPKAEAVTAIKTTKEK